MHHSLYSAHGAPPHWCWPRIHLRRFEQDTLVQPNPPQESGRARATPLGGVGGRGWSTALPLLFREGS